jgi:predicted MPP superfamily phosphohydrolase
MRILQTSDTHWGITKEKAIRKLLQQAATEEFDLLIHCGDYSGGVNGHKTTTATIKLIRQYLPTKPIVTVLGNHDLWTRAKTTRSRSTTSPSIALFQENYDKILQTFKAHSVHFLDRDGLYIHPDFPHIKIIGHTGWYAHPNPPTNDLKYLPRAVEGHTHGWLLKQSNEALQQHIEQLDQVYQPQDVVVFVSHFPVVKAADYKGTFEQFSWSESISKMFQQHYNCKYFLNGHAHMYHNGPLRYESGSDYSKPKYHIIEVK